MYLQKIFLPILGFSLVSFIFPIYNTLGVIAQSKTDSGSVPSDFQPILQTQGVQVYKKITNISFPKTHTTSKTPTTQKEFITIVDIRKASLKNLTGTLVNNRKHQFKVTKKTINQFWQDAASQYSHQKQLHQKKLQVVLNGTFFSTKENPTGIAFGLQTNSKLITYGYAIGNEYPGQITTFAFKPSLSSATIAAYTPQAFQLYPEVVGALHPLADKSAKKYLPRTFVGIKDKNKDSINETVIFYSSNYARQIDAIATLRKFGSHRNAMLDGGGSTGIIVNHKPMILTNRPIPHAIAIYQ
ncbi:MAG: phosphodiester glycosidase family protein [Cyanobacteria bacterium P01_A01_bin.84]